MKKQLASGLAVTMAIVLLGCGSKTDANEKTFGVAIGQFLDKKGGLCLNLAKWPVDVSEPELRIQKTIPASTAGRLAALESVGLTKSEDIETQNTGYDGKPFGGKFKVKRYTLTDAAKPFTKQREVDRVGMNGLTKDTQTDLCWGKKALDKVVKWEGPMKFGDYQEANVKYQYKIEGLAEWSKKPEVLTAFPFIAQVVQEAGKKEQQHGVKLTSAGWEATGLDN